MALRANVVFKGLSVSSAYVRVERIHGGKVEGQWAGLAKVYASETAAKPAAVKVGERQVVIEDVPQIDDEGERVMEDIMAKPTPEFLEEFSVATPWVVDSVPEKLLYPEIEKLIAKKYNASSITSV